MIRRIVPCTGAFSLIVLTSCAGIVEGFSSGSADPPTASGGGGAVASTVGTGGSFGSDLDCGYGGAMVVQCPDSLPRPGMPCDPCDITASHECDYGVCPQWIRAVCQPFSYSGHSGSWVHVPFDCSGVGSCCSADAECAAGQVCVAGTCVMAIVAPGYGARYEERCWTDADCGAGVCSAASVCACDRADCVSRPGWCFARGAGCCISDGDCGAGEECVQGVCRPVPPVGNCWSSNDCLCMDAQVDSCNVDYESEHMGLCFTP